MEAENTASTNDSDDEENVVVVSKADRKALQAAKSGQAILEDSRFSSLFTNPDFAIDEEAHEFQTITKQQQQHSEEI